MLGLQFGEGFKDIKEDIDVEKFKHGFTDGLESKTPLLSQEEMRKIFMEISQKRQAARERVMEKEGLKNLEAGQLFLEENKKKPGVITTESGLQYQVLKKGDGATPTQQDSVTVHYKGTLIDGTEFDSSYSRGEPTSFGVGGVIPGWTEALQLMKVGSKYKLFIPPNLAYGTRGAGGKIGPNATLIFEVELLDIKK